MADTYAEAHSEDQEAYEIIKFYSNKEDDTNGINPEYIVSHDYYPMNIDDNLMYVHVIYYIK